MSKEIRPLTGIRALAAWWVVLYHLIPMFTLLAPGWRIFLRILSGGDLGVDLFFILSGFVLAYNYTERFTYFRRSTWLSFLWLRLARIYPVHLLGLGVWGILAAANMLFKHKPISSGYFGLGALAANLLLVQSWSVPIRMTWNYPAWSISLEWLVYVGFPLFVWLARSLRSLPLIITVAALLSFAPVFGERSYYQLIRVCSEFSLGILVYLLRQRRWDMRFKWNIAPWLWLGASIYCAAVLRILAVPFLALTIYSLSAGCGTASLALGSRFARYWGRVSYSLYIMHAAVISIMHTLLPSARFASSAAHVRLLVVCATIVAIGAAGSLTYHFVEEPFRAKMRAMLDPRVSSPAGAATVA